MTQKNPGTALVTQRSLEKTSPCATERDFLKLIAMDIGKSVAHHIETMYPEAVKAAPGTFLLSVRNHTHNEIMALVDEKGGVAEMLQRIIDRQQHRRKIKAIYRRIQQTEKGGAA